MAAHLGGTERARLRTHIAERYRAGDSIRGLATHTARSYGFIRRLLLEADVTLRPRGGNHRLTR